jgi:hypothetical protein
MIFPTWPPKPWAVLVSLALAVVFGVLFVLDVDPAIPVALAVIVVLARSAPRVIAKVGTLGDQLRRDR